MNEVSPLFVIVAVIAAIITTLVSLKALKGHPILGNPVISILVGLMGFIGLCSYSAKALPAIILPYIALILCIPIVLFLLLFIRGHTESDHEMSGRQIHDSSERERWTTPIRKERSDESDADDITQDDA